MVDCINEIRLVVVMRLGVVRATKMQVGCSVCVRIVRRPYSNCSVANQKKREKKEKRAKCYIIVRRRDNYINIRHLKRKKETDAGVIKVA